MNILITGGAGYIGTELVRKLATYSRIDKIIVYDNLSRPNHNLFLGKKIEGAARIQFVHGELLDSRTLKNSLKDIDVVYHLGAKVTTPFANVDAHMYEQVNHWGTAELVYALEEMSVGKIVYASSAGVYGSSSSEIDELSTPNPATFYGISKLRGEEHVRRLSPKMDTYIFRCGNVYGYSPSMRFDAVINKFVFEANFDKRITIHGDGSQFRSFIHIDSVATALANVIHADLASGTYNLVERSMTVMDVVDALKQLMPDLEFILINQHIKLNNLLIKQNESVNKKLGLADLRPFRDELREFLEKFRF